MSALVVMSNCDRECRSSQKESMLSHRYGVWCVVYVLLPVGTLWGYYAKCAYWYVSWSWSNPVVCRASALSLANLLCMHTQTSIYFCVDLAKLVYLACGCGVKGTVFESVSTKLDTQLPSNLHSNHLSEKLNYDNIVRCI